MKIIRTFLERIFEESGLLKPQTYSFIVEMSVYDIVRSKVLPGALRKEVVDEVI